MFPGGVSSLSVTAYATVGGMPASANEGAIAVITSTAIAGVELSAATPTGVTGKIWVWSGGVNSCLAPIRFTDEVTVFPRAVYQYSAGGSWILKESYVYTSGAWVKLTMFIYDNGVELLGSFTVASSGGDRTALTKETSRMACRVGRTTTGTSNMNLATVDAIDLTDVTAVRIKAVMATILETANLNISGSRTGADAAAAAITRSGALVTATLDVSAFNGNYYVRVYMYDEGNYADSTSYIYEVELVR